MPDFAKIQKLCRLIRYDILTSTTAAGSGHPTSSLSAVELMTTLFFGGFLRYDLENPENAANDRTIISKGHASPLLYSLYHAAGAISYDELMTLRKFGSRLEGHPTPRFKYIDVATGSLGQGLSVGIGMALGMRLSARRFFINPMLKKSYVNKKNDYQKQSIKNSNFNINIGPVYHLDLSSKKTANNIDTIPKDRLEVNNRNLLGASANNVLGKIKTDPNQPADKFVNNPDNTLNQDFKENLIKDNFNTHLPKVWVLLGDSEMAEGQVWEAMQIASYYKLNNLIAIVDVNRLGQRGETMLGWDLQTYAKRAEAFGWETIVVDNGHDLEKIYNAFNQINQKRSAAIRENQIPETSDIADKSDLSGLSDVSDIRSIPIHRSLLNSSDKPTMILAKTIKGKGVSFLEDKNGWHGKAVPKEQLQEALKELGEVDLNVRGQIKAPNIQFQISPSKLDPARRDNFQSNLKSQIQNQKQNEKMLHVTSYMLHDLVATRQAFGDTLVALGETDPRIVVLDAEVSNSTYSEKFAKKFPERYFEMFIAEQNMVSTALGFSKQAFIPFVSTFAAFLTRSFDQIRMSQYSPDTYHLGSTWDQDGNMPNLKIVGSHAGVSIGSDGPSQMALEDLSMMRSIQNCVVFYPCDAVSSLKLTQIMVKNPGIFYLRTTREKTPVIYNPDEKFEIGGSKILRQSPSDVAVVFTAGITVHEALKAYEELKKEQISICVVDLYSVKPIDHVTIQQLSMIIKKVIVVEDHYPYGGIGEAVLSALISQSQIPITNQIPNPNDLKSKKLGQLEIRSIRNFIHLSVNKLPRSGSPHELLHYEEIDSEAIVNAVKKTITS